MQPIKLVAEGHDQKAAFTVVRRHLVLLICWPVQLAHPDLSTVALQPGKTSCLPPVSKVVAVSALTITTCHTRTLRT
jgi:hypothetical protein